MEEELTRWLKAEMNARQDRVVNGVAGSAETLAMWFQHETGILRGLDLVKDWVKEYNKKRSDDEI